MPPFIARLIAIAVVQVSVRFLAGKLNKFDHKKLKRPNSTRPDGAVVQRAPRVMLYAGLFMSLVPPILIGISMWFADSYQKYSPLERIFAVIIGAILVGALFWIPALLPLIRYRRFYFIDGEGYVEARALFRKTHLAHTEITDYKIDTNGNFIKLTVLTGKRPWGSYSAWRFGNIPAAHHAFTQKRRKIRVHAHSYSAQNLLHYLLFKTAIYGQLPVLENFLEHLKHPSIVFSDVALVHAYALSAVNNEADFKRNKERYFMLAPQYSPHAILNSADPKLQELFKRIATEQGIRPAQ